MNKTKISIFFKSSKLYLKMKLLSKYFQKVSLQVMKDLERSERLKQSWSTYHLERSEGLRNLGQPTTSSEARGLGIFVNLPPRAEREAKGSWSTYHLERSEMLRDICELSTSSGARGLGILVNLPPRAKREA